MLLATCGFLMLFAILFLLFKSKTLPVVVFITIPVIAAFAAGFSVDEVQHVTAADTNRSQELYLPSLTGLIYLYLLFWVFQSF